MREADIRPAELLDEFFVRLRRDAERLAAKHAAFVCVACGFCGADLPAPEFAKQGFSYCRCATCGSLQTNPRPTPDALVEYATTSEAVAFWSSHFYSETADARRRHIFGPRASLVTEIARSHGLGESVRFADVGAGYGLFLQELQAAAPGWRLLAIEPDQRLAAICRGNGFETVERWVEGMADGELAMDFISAFEVLEHVYDPAAFLDACRRLLRPGGVAVVTTLTISGFDLQVLGAASRSITPPQHLNFPALTSLGIVAKRAGLELVDLSTPGQLDVDIVRNVLAAQPDLVPDRFTRTLATSDDRTRAAFQRFLQEHLLSSHVRCVLRRPR
jgi:2-polyprenyl-3-methyl-5-hydroxy-6-metoxy-1,4-benzoquinol methylase